MQVFKLVHSLAVQMNSGGTIAFWPPMEMARGVFWTIELILKTTGMVYVTVYGTGKGFNYRGEKGFGIFLDMDETLYRIII